MSTSSINSRRRPPTHCQCGKPLARRVAWTNINPCRRFLNCRNSTNPGMPHCNSFYWIDHELPNEWYKSQLLELYLTLNQEQRVHFLGQLSAQERLEILQDEFEVYQNEMETEIEAMGNKKAELEREINKLKKKTTFWRKFGICVVVLLVLLNFNVMK
ncbi:hypothetical protein Tco_1458569 [Tanacetum coccineum]